MSYGNENSTIIKDKIANRKEIFFHLQYHSRDVSRKKIQELYNEHYIVPKDEDSFNNLLTEHGSIMKISKLTIAYSRPRNLRNHLVHTKLIETKDTNVGDEIKKILLEKGENTDSSRAT